VNECNKDNKYNKDKKGYMCKKNNRRLNIIRDCFIKIEEFKFITHKINYW